ncbi:hypothetical protein HPG69_007680 [Diceros bicornis minor]|uniref:Uncharacterized protein n=1 Tax=Diceros bicornis minor TaxID=77932 RepID=A0A7J7EA34_DICBM|nr:hypothetical protein HPG69_007680 [Diceros bicornis minor]
MSTMNFREIFKAEELFLQDSKLSDLEKQLLSELKFQLGSGEHSQAQGCPTDMSLISESLPSKSSLRECRSKDSGAGTPKARKKSHSVEDRELGGTSLSLSQNEKFSPESYFRIKTKQFFFQWINSKRKITGQESPQQKAKFMSTFEQHQDPAASAALLLSLLELRQDQTSPERCGLQGPVFMPESTGFPALQGA